jgi:hypothetical protein
VQASGSRSAPTRTRELKELPRGVCRGARFDAQRPKTVIDGIYGARQRLGLIDFAVEAQGLLVVGSASARVRLFSDPGAFKIDLSNRVVLRWILPGWKIRSITGSDRA